MKNVEEAQHDIFKVRPIPPPLENIGKSAICPVFDIAVAPGDTEKNRLRSYSEYVRGHDHDQTKSTSISTASPNESAAQKPLMPLFTPVFPSVAEKEEPDLPTRCSSVVDEILTLPTGTSFEECLGSWIKDCLQRKGYNCHKEHSIRDVICQPCMNATKGEILNDIEKFLDHFVREFGVTHYVSAIELGALEYQELTLREFIHQAKVSSEASVTAATYGGAQVTTTQKISRALRSQKSQRKKIGVMEHDKVTEEAVIGCSFFPISGLIKMPYLQQALKNSIDKYVIEASNGMPISQPIATGLS